MSLDGGKVRLRTAVGDPCIWRDYKAVNLHGASVGAFFEDNEGLVNWVNQQPLATPLICLGDGHDGIWNLFADIGFAEKVIKSWGWKMNKKPSCSRYKSELT